MIASTQIKNTEVFAYITVLVFKLLSLGTENTKLLKSRIIIKKLANFTSNLLQKYK